MDKSTLSGYGWIIIVTLILAVMLALATPFGTYVGDGVVAVANSFVKSADNAMDEDNIGKMEDQWDSKFDYGVLNDSNTIDMSKVDPILENNDWATISAVVKAGKAEETGWKVGDTKSVNINGETYDATIIGLDHDGENTATFMIISEGGIGEQYMNPSATNAGGWEASYMREWLSTDIYNSMTDVKDYIKPVTKLTNNIGHNGNSVTGTQDKVFLLSPKETGVEWQMADSNYWNWPDYVGLDALNSEGTIYEWFATNTADIWFWFRSPNSGIDCGFLAYYNYITGDTAEIEHAVCPAFVIG